MEQALAWCESYHALREFVLAHGRFPSESPPLTMWVSNQRTARRFGKLPAERAALLEALPGWHWTQPWHDMYEALGEFARARGRLPRQNETVGGQRLGRWVCAQWAVHCRGELAAEKAALLEAVPGWRWAPSWRDTYDALREFARVHGRAPTRDESVGDLRLGIWVNNQRRARLRGELSAEKAALLEEVPGWRWARDHDSAWRAAHDALCEFVRTHGRLPKTDEPPLGPWADAQRAARAQGRLAAEKASLLDRVPGWGWASAPSVSWHGMYDALREFVRAQKRLPGQSEAVGAWACYQRRARRRGELDAEKVALLAALPGWYWARDFDAAWRATYDELCEFVRARGRLPKTTETVGDLRLGRWVYVQRSSKPAAERAALLERVPGWRWAAGAAEPAGAAAKRLRR